VGKFALDFFPPFSDLVVSSPIRLYSVNSRIFCSIVLFRCRLLARTAASSAVASAYVRTIAGISVNPASAAATLRREPAPAKLSTEEIAWAVANFFVKEERQAERWEDNRELSSLPPVEKELVLQTLREDSAAFGGSDAYGPVNASSALDDFLASEGAALGVVKGSEDYRLLLPLFTRAKAEQILRTIDRVEGRPPGQHDSRFALLNSHTPPPPLPRQTIQFGKFLDGFMAYQREAHAQTTPSIPRTDCHSALSSHAVLATANQRPTAETNGCQ